RSPIRRTALRAAIPKTASSPMSAPRARTPPTKLAVSTPPTVDRGSRRKIKAANRQLLKAAWSRRKIANAAARAAPPDTPELASFLQRVAVHLGVEFQRHRHGAHASPYLVDDISEISAMD